MYSNPLGLGDKAWLLSSIILVMFGHCRRRLCEGNVIIAQYQQEHIVSICQQRSVCSSPREFVLPRTTRKSFLPKNTSPFFAFLVLRNGHRCQLWWLQVSPPVMTLHHGLKNKG